MTWGVARRPKVSNSLGIPHPSEGSDGDIQVRNTGLGSRLFAKLGGRWLSNILYGNEIDDPNVFLPKCWVHKGTFPDFDSGDANDISFVISLPNHILASSVISFSLMARGIVFGGHEGYSLVGDQDDVSTATIDGAMELTVLWETDKSQFWIQGQEETTAFDGEDFILTVFFK